MKFKAVIFDLDGTLVDSVADISDAMNQVLERYDYPTFTYEEYKIFIGHGLKNLAEKVIPAPDKTEQLVDEVFKAMLEVYKANCVVKTKPYPDILSLLNQLAETDLNLSVFSNKADALTKEIAMTLLPDCFDFVLGLTDETLKKPNPFKALEIAKAYNCETSDILFVGDTNVDMQTANNANMHGVGVTWGFRTKTELEANGARYVIDSPLELLDVLSV